MPWDRTRTGTAAKYRTPEHKRERQQRMAQYQRDGYTTCAQPVCVMPTRTIAWPAPVHLLHDDSGTYYLGLGHPQCNVRDAARRASARSHGLDSAAPTRWVL